jgi:ribosomal peptide maturation radical SAM protein 1
MLRPAKVLIIVPPFAHIDRPQLGVHLLQGLARRVGVEVQILYANMLFAAYVDHGTFATLASTSLGLCNAERVFARAAYGVPPMGYDGGAGMFADLADLQRRYPRFAFSTENLLKVESMVDGYLESFLPAIADAGFDVVGCSSSFEQNASSIAILRGLKRRRPATITIMGGANCEGVMAEGLAALTRDVDYIFGGESEETFVAFLEQLGRGERPTGRITHGKPCEDLDGLPTPDYADYYAQLRAWLPTSRWMTDTHVNYETSRGCWWGQKSHCTFCGLNGQGMAMREKSADRAIAELKELLSHHPNRKVLLTDNIMPHAYWPPSSRA